MEDKKYKGKTDYKVIMSELGVSPFRMVRVAFALMAVIPLLAWLYVIIGKNFFYELLLGHSGIVLLVSIFLSIAGFLYAHHLILRMIKRLLAYSYARKQSDDEKTELLLAVTHDLRTPLTVIKSGMQNLAEGIAGALSKPQAEIVRFCLTATDKIAGFVEELLDVSKINFTRAHFARQLINLSEMVKSEVKAIYGLALKNKQNINCSIAERDSDIWADEKKISRVVMNLLSNALKYTPSGGRIDVTLSADESTVKLAIANTGPGISREEVSRIFNKYERLDRSGAVRGVGLGLSIVKDIVELHKGHLTVKSEPGRETEFSVVLPRDLRVG